MRPVKIIKTKNEINNLSKKNNLILKSLLLYIKIVEIITRTTFRLIIRFPAIKLIGIKANKVFK